MRLEKETIGYRKCIPINCVKTESRQCSKNVDDEMVFIHVEFQSR